MFRNFKVLIAIVSVAVLNTPISGAQEIGPLPHAAELTATLGWSPSEAYSWMGSPMSLFVYRGPSQSDDNVVFYYPDHVYLFWFQDRVWQVRVDERWEGEIDGVRIGMSMNSIVSLWGAPINDRDKHPTWTLPDRGYPVRIRLYFDEDNRLNDLYIYRGDW